MWLHAVAALALGAASATARQGEPPAPVLPIAAFTPAEDNEARDDSRSLTVLRVPDTRTTLGTPTPDLHPREGLRPTVDERAVEATLAALGPGFRRSETTHFVILSDCSPEWTWSRAALLERARHQFFRAAQRLLIRPQEHPTKLLCVLINNHAQFRAFGRANDGLDAGWVAGYYAAHTNRIVFYNDAISPEYEQVWRQLADYDAQVADARRRADEARAAGNTVAAHRLDTGAEDLAERVTQERLRLQKQAENFSTAKTIHEAVHLLAFNTGLQRRDGDYPFWLSEGLAASFETDQPDNAFGPDRSGSTTRRTRLRQLVEQNEAPRVAELVMMSRIVLLQADAADAMYAMSTALFEHLYRRERTALSLYLRVLADQAPRRLTPQEHLELFTRHFGDPDELERRIIRELR